MPLVMKYNKLFTFTYPLRALWPIGSSQSFSTLLDWLQRSAPPHMTSNLPLAFPSPIYTSRWFLVLKLEQETIEVLLGSNPSSGIEASWLSPFDR